MTVFIPHHRLTHHWPACWLAILAMLLVACGGGSSAGSSPSATAQAIYFDAVAGDDQNGDGSAAAPYRSLAKLASLSYPGATILYLKRGGTWREPLILPASDITVDAYGTGALPVLDGSRQVGAWQALGNGLFSTAVALGPDEALGNLSEDGVLLDFQPWDTDAATTFATAGNASFSFNYASATLYIKVAGDPTSRTYLASVQLRGVYARQVADITLRNIQIQRFSLHGIEFADCLRCGAENVTVSGIGGAVIGSNTPAPPDYLYAGNGVDFSNSSRDGWVDKVVVSDIFDSGLAIEVFEPNNAAASLDLGNAQLARCGFAGVELSVQSNGGTNTGSSLSNVSLHDIQVDGAGQGWSGRRYGSTGHGIRIVADAGAGNMSNLSMARIQVSNAAGDGIKLAGETGRVSLHRIRSSQNAGVGINVADPVATSLAITLSASLMDHNLGYGLSYNAPQAAGLQIYHNSLVDNGAINLAISAQANQADIRNNLFYASSPMTHLYAAAPLVNATLDHNCYNDTSNMIGYNNTAYSSLAAFRADSGFEANGRGDGNVGLTNPAADFTLQPGSDCIGLGDTTLGVIEDYDGRAFANSPASGAYEGP